MSQEEKLALWICPGIAAQKAKHKIDVAGYDFAIISHISFCQNTDKKKGDRSRPKPVLEISNEILKRLHHTKKKQFSSLQKIPALASRDKC